MSTQLSGSFSPVHKHEILEAWMGEAVFTVASDAKPVVATYGCCPCIALGGYDATNKMAFVVHVTNAKEIENSGERVLQTIQELAKREMERPIQIHLRGGLCRMAESEASLSAIKEWTATNGMTIASNETLLPDWESSKDEETSLRIDSRTGRVEPYVPCTVRDFFGFDGSLDTIKIAYKPRSIL